MVAGAEFSPPLTMLDSPYGHEENGSSPGCKDRESVDKKKEMKVGKPPRHLPHVHRASTVRFAGSTDFDFEFGSLDLTSPQEGQSGFLPVFRSGSCSEIGPKKYMEDEHICVDNLVEYLGGPKDFPAPGAFYGVFDGHGDSRSLDRSSGTTALVALIFGRTMLIANAGDCRAVLGKRGRAIELSRDHKPNCKGEKLRIEKLGGFVYDGYLNGQLSVSRALGDWHLKGTKGCLSPLSSEPDLHETLLTEEAEFLVIGCDGLWDVMSSQCAVTMVRKELMIHNDPERCSRALVQEALKRNTCDNLTVVVVCFSSDPPPRIEIPTSRVRRSISLEGLHLLKGALDSNV
ncbi:probable protein phosphatase 2C 27 isoform X2 [Typha latifolia]|uniref:probable protein phosphatase 2C 27 isoform X2 n=1 Tax=Typha latifolia TaxID=4733 RepID=UPI003C2DD183